MEIIQLRVVVDKSQLAALQAEVAKLQGGTYYIHFNVTGLDSIKALTNAQAKAIKSANDLAIAQEGTKQSADKLKISENQLATQMGRTTTAASKAKPVLKQTGDAAKQTGDSIGKLVGKVALWAAATTLIYGPIRAFKEALTTMKAVDDELVVVRKVTGATTAELAALEKQSYKTASAYGVSADKYLASVANMTRAGYGDLAADLAELSVKTQLVGDVTEDVADQFLLSVDAAYKYEGNVQRLSAVLDGANAIDNSYATSIGKIAEGLGKVAPIASQAHVGVNELTSAIGTITAVTQRSGTEASTALRALFLNILGDTKTQFENEQGEIVSWTMGEIAGLQDVVRLYASDAYNAAKATGELINPMEAIAGLAQSMKDGLLTEEQLMGMVSDIGGKLRTGQLLALIQNWDMYQSMLGDYASAMGSADREVENALDSWTRKTEILKNKWTEFVSGLIDTEVIKGGLDVVIGIVDVLDTVPGKAVLTAGAIMLIGSAISGLNKTTVGGAFFKAFSNPKLLIAAGIVAAIIGVVGAIDALIVTLDEYDEKITESENKVEEIRNKIQTAQSNNEPDAVIAAYDNQLKRAIANTEKLKAARFRMEFDAVDPNSIKPGMVGVGANTAQEAKNKILSLVDEYHNLQDAIDEATLSTDKEIAAFEQMQDQLANTGAELADYYSDMKEGIKTGQKLTATDWEIYEALTEVFGSAEDVAAAHITAGAAMMTASDDAQSYIQALIDTGANAGLTDQAIYDLINQAISFNNTNLDVSQKVAALSLLLSWANAAGRAVSAATGGGGTAGGGAGRKNKNGAEYEETPAPTGGGGGGSGKTEDKQLKALEEMVDILKSELDLMQESKSDTVEITKYYKGFTDAVIHWDYVSHTSPDQGHGYTDQEYTGNLVKGMSHEYIGALNKFLNQYFKRSDLTGDTFTEETEKALVMFMKENRKTTLANPNYAGDPLNIVAGDAWRTIKAVEDSWGNLYDHTETVSNSIADQIAKMREVQAALHEQAEYMRSVKSSQADINELSTEWWEIEQDINDLLLDNASVLMDEMDKAKDERLEVLDAELDALKAQREEKDAALELEEKQLAVQKARIALENAQRERNVRYFNASTNQWEWGANAANVQSAQAQYESAVDSLNKYLEQKAYNETVAHIENEKEKITSAYESFADAWDLASEAVEEGSMTLAEAYAYMAKTTLDIFNRYSVNLSDSLKALATGTNVDAGAALGYDANVDYSSKMLASTSYEEFNHWANKRDLKTLGENIDIAGRGYSSNEELLEQWKKDNTYDSGGVLYGLGGIKATSSPEGVLDPAITKAMLSPQANAIFAANAARVGALFGVPQGGTTAVGSSTSTTNTYGASYHFGNISLSEQQAEGMSVAQLVRLAGSLVSHNNC